MNAKAIVKSVLRTLLLLALVLAPIVFLLRRSMVRAEDSGARTAVKSDLRTLSIRQEEYLRDSARYADDASLLDLRPNQQVTLGPLEAGKTWWKAVGRHDKLRGQSCVIWGGDLAASQRPLTDKERRSGPAGEPVCDLDRR